MKKLVSVLLVASMMVSTGVATTNYDGPRDKPHVMDQPVDQPNATSGPGFVDLPSLPGQASDTARQVLSTIQNAFQSSVQGLGEALQDLLGNGGNETASNQ